MHSTVSHPNLSPVDVVDSRYSFIDHPTSSYLSDSDDEVIERCDDANLDCVVMNPVKSYTSISKHLNIPMSPKKILKKNSVKVSGRVLTSNENIEIIERKEEKKKEEKRVKEERLKLKAIAAELKARSKHGMNLIF